MELYVTYCDKSILRTVRHRAFRGVQTLSHLLFNILLSDISSCISTSDFLKFVNDIKLFQTISAISDCENLKQGITALTGWCKDNNLALNPTKMKLIYFSRNHCRIAFQYILENCLVEEVSVVRDLGVLLDSELKFPRHAEFLT